MQDKEVAALATAIAALEGQRSTLGDAALELALTPLRTRLAGLQRRSGLQRRQVTVLFADVVGSTAMANGMDTEDTLDVLSGALRRMAALVEAHQGRVLRFTGDGVKAAFGMDETREDDPERAVRAGLAILKAGREQADGVRRDHGIADFAVRVGVHTGDVAFGAGVEADDTAIRRARIYADTPAAWVEAGDLTQPLAAGTISMNDIVGTLEGLCRGTVIGRATAGEITLFKSVGSAIEDLAAARLVFSAAAPPTPPPEPG